MASKSDHLERTAAEPRDKSLHTVVLQHIEQVNDTTRVFRLGIPQGSPPIRFLPGQWLDVYVPGVERAGGFTITSAPREARRPHPPPPDSNDNDDDDDDDGGDGDGDGDNGKGDPDASARQGPYLELAVQKSPESAPAAWLWRDPSPTTTTTTTIAAAAAAVAAAAAAAMDPSPLLGAELRVRVGGGFVWPPPGVNVRGLRRVVFVAGGVGVNPLVSMLSSLALAPPPPSPSSPSSPASGSGPAFEVRFLYSLRDAPGFRRAAGRPREAARMLFLGRVARLFRTGAVRGGLRVFLTGGEGGGGGGDGDVGDDDDDDDDGEGRDAGIVCRADGDGHADFVIPFHPRRCTVEDDVAKAVGATPAERRSAVVYVCGVPAMTDEFVARLTDRGAGLGMEPHRVLFEKWW